MTDRRSKLLAEYRECGSSEARDALASDLMPLVHSLARRYADRGEDLDDLVQVGAIGLLKAIERFDPDHGTELVSYAAPTIVGELKRHFRDKGWAMHVPRGLKDLNRRLNSRIDSLAAEHGRSPSITELAAAEGTTEEEVIEALDAGYAYSPQSLSAPVGDDSGSATELLSTIGDVDPAFEASEQRSTIRSGVQSLDERERRILLMRFYEGMTQSEIAEEIGISQMHVSRLIRKSLQEARQELDPDE